MRFVLILGSGIACMGSARCEGSCCGWFELCYHIVQCSAVITGWTCMTRSPVCKLMRVMTKCVFPRPISSMASGIIQAPRRSCIPF